MNKNAILLSVTILIGFVLRLTSAISHSYSSDELSAIIRLKFTNFDDLIELGVKTGDMHPAGVQIFMKLWSLLFGTSELALRLPFVILGTLSIYLIFLIGKRYSIKIGLFSAASWSVSLFPIIQSELARPYSPGLVFVLLTAIFILKFIFNEQSKKQQWLTTVWLSLSIVSCMYTHYFAFLLAGFMSVTALFWINRNKLLPYITSGFVAVILFLPHLKITIYQISIDGGLQWLAPPGKFWLFKFIFHAFNDSWFIVSSFLIAIVAVCFYHKKYFLSRQSMMMATWFFGIYIFAHILSHAFTPILKYPVMLFAFPFFVILVSKLLSPLFNKKVIPVAFIIIILISTTLERKLWGNGHHEVFKELVDEIRDWEKNIGKENITIIMNVSNPDYLNYYAKQTGDYLKFSKTIIDYGDADTLEKILTNIETDYLIFGFSGRHTPIQFLNQSLIYFPYIENYSSYTNSAIFLLSKHQSLITKSFNVQSRIDFFKDQKLWKFELKKLNTNNQDYIADRLNQYSPEYKLKLNNALIENNSFVKVTIKADIDISNEVTIVAVPENKFGEPIQDNYGNPIWMGLDVESLLIKKELGSFTFSVPENTPIDGQIKIYIWNRNQHPFTISHLNIEIIENIWNN